MLSSSLSSVWFEIQFQKKNLYYICLSLLLPPQIDFPFNFAHGDLNFAYFQIFFGWAKISEPNKKILIKIMKKKQTNSKKKQSKKKEEKKNNKETIHQTEVEAPDSAEMVRIENFFFKNPIFFFNFPCFLCFYAQK